MPNIRRSMIHERAVTGRKIATDTVTTANLDLAPDVEELLDAESIGEVQTLLGVEFSPLIDSLLAADTEAEAQTALSLVPGVDIPSFDDIGPTVPTSLQEGGGSTLTIATISNGQILARVGDTVDGLGIGAGLSVNAGSISADTATWPTTDEKAALGGSSGTPGSTNPFVTSADSRLTGASGGAALAAAAEYGTGALGDFILDGVNTYSGILTLAGSTYTCAAGVVLNVNNMRIDSGITLKPAGSPLRVLGLLTWNGAIDCSGSAASGHTGGAGAAPAATPGVPATGNVYSGGDTGTDGTVTNAPGGASSLTSNTICLGGQGGSGGQGVYSTTVRAGGTGTLASSAIHYEHYHGELQILLQIGRADAGTSRLYLCGGAGGAGGGNSIGSGSGTLRAGGGGGGGGIAAVFARTATIGASATLNANAGAGGDATYTTPGGNAGSGGGGGGGGGVAFLKIGKVIGTQQLPTISANGGNGGAANSVGAGFGDGGAGGKGGKAICIVANYTGSAPTMTNTGGTGGALSGTGGSAGANGTAGPTTTYISL